MKPTTDIQETGLESESRHAGPHCGAALEQVNDCWNQIGVTGDGSCPELARFVHCRNCPTYSSAGARLLNRRIPPEYRQEWTRHVSRAKAPVLPGRLTRLDAQSRTAGRLSVLIFRLGTEWLALPTQALQEVAAFATNQSKVSGLIPHAGTTQDQTLDFRPQTLDSSSTLAQRCVIHSLPHRRRSVVLGLVNVRGELVICVSLSRLLNEAHSTASDAIQCESASARLLVAEWDGNRLVFPVDEVHGVHRVQPDDLKDPPATLTGDNWRTKIDATAATSHASQEALRRGVEPARVISYVRSVFVWHEKTVGLLDAELLFATLNRNLA